MRVHDLWNDLIDAVEALLNDGHRETAIQDEIDHMFVKWHKQGARPLPDDEEGVAIPELVKLFKDTENAFNDPSGSLDVMSNIDARMLNLETRIQSLELRLAAPTRTVSPFVAPLTIGDPLVPPSTTSPKTTFIPITRGFTSGCGCGGACGGNSG